MENKNTKQNVTLGFMGFITGFCNGLFGSGGGMMAVPSMEKYTCAEPKKAHATAIAVILPLTVVSIFRYMSFCTIDIRTLSAVVSGGVLGSVAGAFVFKKISSRLLCRCFAWVIIITAVRMVIS